MQAVEYAEYAYTTSVTEKGQVTLPAPIRRLLGVMPHDKVTFVVVDGQVRVISAASVTARTAGLLADEQPMLSPRAEKDLAEETMAAEALE